MTGPYLITRIYLRLKRDYFKWRYQTAAANVLRTRPIGPGNLPFTVLSQVHTRDVIPYLVAIKSFAAHANPLHIVIVCDPTISATDRKIFKEHIPHVELRDASEFASPRAPRGGTWERLLAISEYVTSQYVVQLDADTITTGPISEVIEAIQNNAGFVIGEESAQLIMSLEEAKNYAIAYGPSKHVQALAELSMAELGFPSTDKYVRGCSGFTGFPTISSMKEKLLEYSEAMAALTGERWNEWGTEQVTSNYLVANANRTSILPFPKYCTPDARTHSTVFQHFIGSLRFKTSAYEKTSSKVITELNSKTV